MWQSNTGVLHLSKIKNGDPENITTSFVSGRKF